MHEYPLISIIISSYRQMHFIFLAIDSVLKQDYPNIELIVTDDGTDDFNITDVKHYIECNNRGNISRIKVLKNSVNVGTVKNLNGALAVVEGKYVMFLDGDDLHAAQCISKAADFMESNRHYFVAAGHVILFNDGEDILTLKIIKDATLHDKLGMESHDRYVYMCKKVCLPTLVRIFSNENSSTQNDFLTSVTDCTKTGLCFFALHDKATA